MSLKALIGSVLVGIAVVAGSYFVIAPRVSDVPAGEPEAEESAIKEYGTYRNDEYGLTFKYRVGADGYALRELETPSGEDLEEALVLIHADDVLAFENPPAGGEGPAVITINVFENEKKQWARQWAEANPGGSNINLAMGEVRDAVVGGANAIRYRADGLYASEVAVIPHGSYVYVVSGAFTGEDSPTYRDFEPLLESLTFVPESGEDESEDVSEEDDSEDVPLATTPAPAQISAPASPTTAPAPTSAPAPAPKPSGYTLADVANHADATSCWSAIGGNVYDLTGWVGKHPGGEKNILRLCGKDGTSLFEGKHGGDAKPEAALTGYLIGPLI